MNANSLFLLGRPAVALLCGLVLGAVSFAQNTTDVTVLVGNKSTTARLSHRPPPAPGVPTNLTMATNDQSTLDLTWSAAVPLPNRTIMRYDIFLNGKKIADATDTSAIVAYNPADPLLEYFAVRGVDNRGNASPVSEDILAPRGGGDIIELQTKIVYGNRHKYRFYGLLDRVSMFKTATYTGDEGSLRYGENTDIFGGHPLIGKVESSCSFTETFDPLLGTSPISGSGQTKFFDYVDGAFVQTRVESWAGTSSPSSGLGFPDSGMDPDGSTFRGTAGATNTHAEVGYDSLGGDTRVYRHETITYSNEFTETELDNGTADDLAAARSFLPTLAWNENYGVFFGFEDHFVRDIAARREFVGATPHWDQYLGEMRYRFRVASFIGVPLPPPSRGDDPPPPEPTGPTTRQHLRWAEVFTPFDGGAPEILAVRDEVVEAIEHGPAYTQEYFLSVPDRAGSVKPMLLQEIAETAAQRTAISQARFYLPDTLGVGQVAEIQIKPLAGADGAIEVVDFGSIVIVVGGPDPHIRLMAIDPLVELQFGLDAAIAQGAVIPSGTNLRTCTFNGLAYGEYKVIAFGQSAGTAAVTVTFGSASTATVTRTLTVLTLELAVDVNRDGQVKLPSENSTDQTSTAVPFRFWLNDDNDYRSSYGNSPEYYENSKDEVASSVMPDYGRSRPNSARDLEDFARMWLRTSGITSALKNGDLYLGLKWTNVTGAPAIKIVEHVEATGGTAYLSSMATAGLHLGWKINDTRDDGLSMEGRRRLIQPSEVFVLPTALFSQLTESAPTTYLLFEGAGLGKGLLKPVLLKKEGQNYTSVGEGDGVWLDLKNIKSMYERAVATTGGPRSENGVDYTIPVPSDLTGPDDNNIPHPTMGWAPNPLGYPYEPDPAETNTYIIYVHGWRWSPEKANNRTETVFKRLCHLGYKGRLAALRWPTFYGGPDDDDSEPAGIFTYNNSEYRAWKSGESLKLYVNQLPSGYTRHVVAHSMGNIVAGAALKNGMSVANYIMLNAAVPAMCYDESTSLRQSNWNYTTPNTDPDAGTRSLAYIGKFGTLNTNVVNFFLTNDTATRTLWEINNSTWRPHRYNLGTTGYGYDPSAIVGRRLYITFFTAFGRYLIDPHEAMPYASQSLTRTVGADGRTRGSIGSVVDLDASFGFGDEHGAEWERTYQATRAFYAELMRTLQIPVQP